jgi:small GTP-binding protein
MYAQSHPNLHTEQEGKLMDTGRVLSSQTIGVEFSSKIVKVGSGPRRKRIKLQLWDTAGTERFRSVSRSYYRGAAGAILVYDVASYTSFAALSTFLMDARALASPNLTTLLAGNKADLVEDDDVDAGDAEHGGDVDGSAANSFASSRHSSSYMYDAAGTVTGSMRSVASTVTSYAAAGTRMTATTAHGRQVGDLEALEWATRSNIPVAVEVSALTGANVDELFTRLARIILTKIELGEIDPDDPQSGIQYGDSGAWAMGTSDGGSVRSGLDVDDTASQLHRRKRRQQQGGSWGEWGDVFRIQGSTRRAGCC